MKFCSCLQREDAIKIRDFIIQHVPHAIIIEASGINCKQLYNLFEDVESDILENNPQVCLFINLLLGACLDPQIWQL